MLRRPSIRHLLIAPLLFAGLVAQTVGKSHSPSDTVWHTDFGKARKLAAERHAPLFVMFRCER